METERLKFRIIADEDAPFLFRLMNTEKWHYHIGDRKVYDEEAARSYIRSRMSPELSEKGFINYVMIEKKTNRKVGTCSIHDREGVAGLDIGYALLSEFEGFGYAREGATRLANLTFQKFKQKQISAITTNENIRSCNLLEKMGFKHQSNIRLPNGSVELKLYVLHKRAFQEKNKAFASQKNQ